MGPRGLLIVFEGLDRSGKSTQCGRLCESLRAAGHEVKHMRFPDRTTPIGIAIDAYLRGQTEAEDHVIHLLFSANRWEAAPQMRRDLEAGITLVVDRYGFSGAVYSAAKQNPSLPLEWAWQQEIGLPKPDLTFYMTVSPEVAAQRGGFGGERYEKQEMQDKVGTMFRQLFSEGLRMSTPELYLVDADRSIQEVESQIISTTHMALKQFSTRPTALQTLSSLYPTSA